MLRTWALPSVLMVLENNTHRGYPQDLAEIGLAAEIDGARTPASPSTGPWRAPSRARTPPTRTPGPPSDAGDGLRQGSFDAADRAPDVHRRPRGRGGAGRRVRGRHRRGPPEGARRARPGTAGNGLRVPAGRAGVVTVRFLSSTRTIADRSHPLTNEHRIDAGTVLPEGTTGPVRYHRHLPARRRRWALHRPCRSGRCRPSLTSWDVRVDGVSVPAAGLNATDYSLGRTYSTPAGTSSSSDTLTTMVEEAVEQPDVLVLHGDPPD